MQPVQGLSSQEAVTATPHGLSLKLSTPPVTIGGANVMPCLTIPYIRIVTLQSLQTHYIPRQCTLQYKTTVPPPNACTDYTDCTVSSQSKSGNLPLSRTLGWIGRIGRHIMRQMWCGWFAKISSLPSASTLAICWANQWLISLVQLFLVSTNQPHLMGAIIVNHFKEADLKSASTLTICWVG